MDIIPKFLYQAFNLRMQLMSSLSWIYRGHFYGYYTKVFASGF